MHDGEEGSIQLLPALLRAGRVTEVGTGIAGISQLHPRGNVLADEHQALALSLQVTIRYMATFDFLQP